MKLNEIPVGALEALFAQVMSQRIERPPQAAVAASTPPRPDECRYLSVNEVCELLGVSRAKWYYLIKPGHKYHDASIPPWVPVGERGRKWRRDEILAWAESRKSRSAST